MPNCRQQKHKLARTCAVTELPGSTSRTVIQSLRVREGSRLAFVACEVDATPSHRGTQTQDRRLVLVRWKTLGALDVQRAANDEAP